MHAGGDDADSGDSDNDGIKMTLYTEVPGVLRSGRQEDDADVWEDMQSEQERERGKDRYNLSVNQKKSIWNNHFITLLCY